MRALLLLVLLLAPVAASADGAIAYDSVSGRFGYSWNLPPGVAQNRALAHCGTPGCRVVANIPPGHCGALSSTGNHRGWGAAVRQGRDQARVAAFDICQRYNFGQCHPRVWDCSR